LLVLETIKRKTNDFANHSYTSENMAISWLRTWIYTKVPKHLVIQCETTSTFCACYG